jgi:hypothetical protein
MAVGVVAGLAGLPPQLIWHALATALGPQPLRAANPTVPGVDGEMLDLVRGLLESRRDLGLIREQMSGAKSCRDLARVVARTVRKWAEGGKIGCCWDEA